MRVTVCVTYNVHVQCTYTLCVDLLYCSKIMLTFTLVTTMKLKDVCYNLTSALELFQQIIKKITSPIILYHNYAVWWHFFSLTATLFWTTKIIKEAIIRKGFQSKL